MGNVKYTDADGNARYTHSTKTGDNTTPDLSPEDIVTKMPALGVAGTPSVDVITVQGIASGVAQPIIGNVASGAADSGNPVKMGGVYNTSLPTLTNGQRGDIQLDANGKLIIASTNADPATGTNQTTGNTSIAAVSTAIGAQADSAAAGDTSTASQISLFKRLLQRMTTLIAGIPLLAGEAHIGEVGGNLTSVAVEFTRPADTTAYAAGDVVSDNTTTTTMQAIAAAARVSGGSGYIVGIRVSTDKKSITPRFRIHFFNTTGATLAGDNVAHKEVYADSAKRVGFWDMPAMSTATDTTNSDMSRSIDMTVRLPYTCAVTSLYYVLEALDAFTPASGQKFTVTVYPDRN